MKKIIFVTLVFYLSIISLAVKDVRLLRMPDINNDQIVLKTLVGHDNTSLQSHIVIKPSPTTVICSSRVITPTPMQSNTS